MAAVVACWWAVLIALVVFTSNPVTLNRRQIRNSEQVVTAEIIDPANGNVKVLKDWSGGGSKGEIRVQGLNELRVKAGARYILPLTMSPRGEWQVTPAPDSSERRLVYPANEKALQQLADLLNSAKTPGRQ